MDFKIGAPNGVRACLTEYRECTAKCPVGAANYESCIKDCITENNKCKEEGGHPNA
ncbi:MAG: hypothetical protein K2W92_08800 [Alphaproteobacteria bacterium]|nr:hypothetical protein [Alphaproteobacteria bacterium]